MSDKENEETVVSSLASEIDPKELTYPDTVFVRDIETRVFQMITVKTLATIEGIYLIEGGLFDNLLGREGAEKVKGIHVEQDSKSHSVNIKIELNIGYGISIPDKSEEIQTRLVEDIVNLTGLHVASVHIVFKNLLQEEDLEAILADKMANVTEKKEESEEEALNEYSEEF